MAPCRSAVTLGLIFFLSANRAVTNAPTMHQAFSVKQAASRGVEQPTGKERLSFGDASYQDGNKILVQHVRRVSKAWSGELGVTKARAFSPLQDTGGVVSLPKHLVPNKTLPTQRATEFSSEMAVDCTAQPYQQISEREPNNNPDQAQPITPPVIINGFAAPGECRSSGCWCFDANDNDHCDSDEDYIEDWYRFTLSEAATVRVTLCVPNPAGVVFTMVASPNIPGANSLPAFAGFSGAPPGSFALTLEPGNYLIPVSNDDFHSKPSNYTLVVEATPVTVDHTLGFSNRSGRTSDPVNTVTGNYTYQHVDLAIPGRGLPLVFQRTYNSQDSYQGPFGIGWTHNYNVFLYEILNLLFIKWGDGRIDSFRRNPDGSYQTTFPDIYDQLVKRSDGTFLLTKKDQTQYIFDKQGRLSRIADRNGNTITLSYDTSGNLDAITDTVGRKITLTYLPNGRLTQLIDPVGRVTSYAYDEDGNLAGMTDARGGVTDFFYDGANRLTQIIDPRANRLVTNTYDSRGRVIGQTNAKGLTTKGAI